MIAKDNVAANHRLLATKLAHLAKKPNDPCKKIAVAAMVTFGCCYVNDLPEFLNHITYRNNL